MKYSSMYGIRGNEDKIESSAGRERVLHEFLLLLVTILPLQVIYPVLSGSAMERPLLVLFFSLILLSGVWIMRGSRRRFLMAAILTLVSLELLWSSLWPAAAPLLLLGEFCLLLLLFILVGRSIGTFIRTDLKISDLLLIIAALFLLTGTTLGLSLYLLGSLYPVTGSGGPEIISLPGYLTAGISILTLQGAGTILSVHTPPLVRVVMNLGMIGGILLVILAIGKVVIALQNRNGAE